MIYAFPHKGYVEDDNGVFGEANFAGMTLRDHFAGLAMQALVERYGYEAYDGDHSDIEGMSYEIADAMMHARKD